MSRWAAAFAAIREGRAPDTMDTMDTMAGDAVEASHSVHRVHSVTPPVSADEGLAGDPADDDGPWPEPPLPPLGTPARERLDRDRAATVAGLLLGFRRHTGGGQ